MSEQEFWGSTPFVTGLAVKAYQARQRHEFRRAVWQAYQGEVFARIKKLPSLADVMARLDGKAPRATRLSQNEIERKIAMLNAAFGGHVIPRGVRNG